MKLAHISDIHGDLKMLERASRLVQKASDAEVLAITGDIAGSVLEGEERDYFLEVAQSTQNLRDFLYQHTKGKIDTTKKAAEAVIEGVPGLKFEDLEETKEHAKRYLELEAKTKQGLRTQYQGVKDILESMPQEKVLVPGNWDCHCMDDYLAKYNLHNRDGKDVKIKGVHFVGYGGASGIPIEIPEEWLIDFDEDEAYKHLVKNTDPNEATIALVHNPVRGHAGNGARGSFALRAYVNLRQPDAVLQGHSHKAEIAEDKETGTLISTPGNLGRYEDSPGGTFAEIEYDEETGIVSPSRAWTIKGDHDAQPYSFEKKAS